MINEPGRPAGIKIMLFKTSIINIAYSRGFKYCRVTKTVFIRCVVGLKTSDEPIKPISIAVNIPTHRNSITIAVFIVLLFLIITYMKLSEKELIGK